MKRKIIVIISLTLLLCSELAYNVLAYNSGTTDLYPNGPSSFSYYETTNIDNYNGWPICSVSNYVYVNGSSYDYWSVSSSNPTSDSLGL